MKLPLAEERSEPLSARQHKKMAASVQRFVRGSTARFYQWLEERAGTLPEGPTVWICGDCHYGNLGPVANSQGDVEIQIRDLDQAVIGNPAHDLVRLAFSLASAARGFDLPGAVTAELVEQAVDGYQAALLEPHAGHGDRPPLIEGLLRSSRKRSWKHLARERIQDASPEIPLGKRFWPLSKSERAEVEALIRSDDVVHLITALKQRADHGEVRLLDAAWWVKGCSSLGLLRLAVLVALEDSAGSADLGLIDVKEAVKPAAPRADDAKMPRENGKRVVEAARRLSPHLGSRMTAGRVLDRSVFVRELLPQDLKLELSSLRAKEMVTVARFLAGVVGRAHGRQMSDLDRESWAAELNRRRSRNLDAPSWLWTSVVELMAAHEGAYLEHCRRYAQVVT